MQIKAIIFASMFLIMVIVYFALPPVQYFFNGGFSALATLNTNLFSQLPELVKWGILGSMIAFSLGIIYKLYGENGKF